MISYASKKAKWFIWCFQLPSNYCTIAIVPQLFWMNQCDFLLRLLHWIFTMGWYWVKLMHVMFCALFFLQKSKHFGANNYVHGQNQLSSQCSSEWIDEKKCKNRCLMATLVHWFQPPSSHSAPFTLKFVLIWFDFHKRLFDLR